jgi:hypothetical protein
MESHACKMVRTLARLLKQYLSRLPLSSNCCIRRPFNKITGVRISFFRRPIRKFIGNERTRLNLHYCVFRSSTTKPCHTPMGIWTTELVGVSSIRSTMPVASGVAPATRTCAFYGAREAGYVSRVAAADLDYGIRRYIVHSVKYLAIQDLQHLGLLEEKR